MNECKLEINQVRNFFASWAFKEKCKCCGQYYYRKHSTLEKIVFPLKYLHVIPILGDLIILAFLGLLIIFLPWVSASLFLFAFLVWVWDVKNEHLILVNAEIEQHYHKENVKLLWLMSVILVIILVSQYVKI